MEIMKIIFYISFCIFITSCTTKHYVELSNEKIKNINIPKDYTAIYCSCDNNPLQASIIDKLIMTGIKVIKIDDHTKINEIKSNKSIVIYGYNKTINESPKNYSVTNLVKRSESINCGKGCTISRRWNQIVRKTVTTSGDSIHNNVLIYKIDENTELLMAVNSGDKYSINLNTKKETGGEENIVSESNAYKFN